MPADAAGPSAQAERNPWATHPGETKHAPTIPGPGNEEPKVPTQVKSPIPPVHPAMVRSLLAFHRCGEGPRSSCHRFATAMVRVGIWKAVSSRSRVLAWAKARLGCEPQEAAQLHVLVAAARARRCAHDLGSVAGPALDQADGLARRPALGRGGGGDAGE